GFDRGRRKSGAYEGTLFRGRRYGRTRFRGKLRAARKERGALASDRARAERRGAGPGRANATCPGTHDAVARAARQAQRQRLVQGRRGARTVSSRNAPASAAPVTSFPRRQGPRPIRSPKMLAWVEADGALEHDRLRAWPRRKRRL